MSVLRASLVAAVAVAGGMLGASPAAAAGPPPGSEFAITSFLTEVKDSTGADETRAAAHPFSARAEFKISSYSSGISGRDIRPVEDPKTIVTKLPPGFSGDPMVTAQCPLVLVPRVPASPMLCPDDTVVGYVYADGAVNLSAPLVNVRPEEGYPAEFAFSEAGLTYTLYPELRSDGDYGLNIVVPGASNDALTRIDVTFCGYGVESDLDIFATGASTFRCLQMDEPGALSKPFLTNPATECTDRAPFTDLEINSWQTPGVFKTARAVSPLITSCDTLEFDPTVNVAPTTSLPDAPTGLSVDMAFPQEDNELGQAQPALKKVVVTLPEGMTINPSAANGLSACSDEQLKLKSKQPVECPDASKIGSVTAKSPLMKETLTGGVYIRSQNSDDPESGEMFRLGLVLENKERGISVRLPGSIVADKNTGRLVTTFDNNPELPVSNINLKFMDGPRGPLATPPTCGEKTSDITLTSWGKQTVTRHSSFTVDCTAGLGDFSPAFNAGAENPLAGGSSPFNLRIDRADGQDVLAGVKVDLPSGLLATIKGNLGTQVGDVDVAAGPGSQPFWLKGKAFLEGRYDDAPFSLRVVVPAKAGPFDLGEVVVRQKLYVDKHDAHVTVVSDPVPIVVKGVPVRLRTLNVSVNKPGFMRNPTSCDAKQITGTLTGGGGLAYPVSSRFQVGGCENLPFNPVFAAQSGGKLKFKKGASLKVHMAIPDGHANIALVETTLPKELPSRLIPTIRNACVMDQYLADYTKCPELSYIGTVSAVTPLLEEPLKGPAYIVAPPNDVPRVELKLFGQGTSEGVQVDLEGDVIVDIGDGRSRVTFKTVPDVPVTSFDVDFPAGDHSILDAPSYDTCKGPIKMDVTLIGQNGKRVDQAKTVKVTDCPKYGKAKITGAKVTKTGVSLRVKPPVGDGRMTVTGSGLTPVVRKVDRRWTYSVRVPLSAAGKRALARTGSLKTRLTVAFKPTNSPKTTKAQTKTLTITTKRSSSAKRTIVARKFW